MNEKALKPQFYKHLTYNQFRDVIPERKRVWDGNVNSQLDSIKLYDHPEDYKDMLYSHAFPDTNLNYPTSRKSGNPFQHPSFDVPIPVLPQILETVQFPFLILNFNGVDGATTYIEEAQNLSPSVNSNCELDTDQYYEGITSLLVNPVSGMSKIEYTVPIGKVNTKYFSYSGRFRCEGFESGSEEQFYRFGSNSGNGAVQLALASSTGITVKAYDNDDDEWDHPFINYSGTHSYDINIWHKFEINVNGRVITVLIDDVAVIDGIASIHSPMSAVDYFDFGSTYNINKVWVDAVRGTNYY